MMIVFLSSFYQIKETINPSSRFDHLRVNFKHMVLIKYPQWIDRLKTKNEGAITHVHDMIINIIRRVVVKKTLTFLQESKKKKTKFP